LFSDESHPLDEIFHPKSIAIIGASASERGLGWVARLIESGYTGHIYPVNPNATEISGLKAYSTVRDIPGPVDYAIFNIPARLTPQIMADCATKGVKVAHLYTAGFSETGKEEDKNLEAQVSTIAREGGVRVIGPNCMGIYYPAAGITFSPQFSKEPGNVSFVSQTGTGATRFVYLANEKGIHFSKVVSYGNAIDLDAQDFLEYLASDEETGIIACYIEGVKDGPRFMKAIRLCLEKKPVIVFKVGLTEGGAGAAASHTGSLAGSALVWDAFFKQTRAIQVNTVEELTDVTLALLHMPAPKGRRVGLVGRGGGIGVMAADTCERAGLRLPPFLPETKRKLEDIVPAAGAGLRNPVETPRQMKSVADFYARGLRIVDSDPQIDFILTHMAVDIYGERASDQQQTLMETMQVLADTAPALTKPIAVVLYADEYLETISSAMEARKMLMKAGIPAYPTIDSAARAISKIIEYRESRLT